MLKNLNQAFTKLPGVGAKTAQRFIYYLLENNKKAGIDLGHALIDTMNNIKECAKCRYLTGDDICHICANDNRSQNTLCIVETSKDVDIIEQTQSYNGLYFVLNGYLSPIDNIGAEDLGIDIINDIVKEKKITEVILATNTTIEGEITAYYVNNIIKKYNIKITQLAHGIPLGGELEYSDINTISRAITDRKELIKN